MIKVVAQAQARLNEDMYNELGRKEGLNKIIKLSKARNISTKHVTHIKN